MTNRTNGSSASGSGSGGLASLAAGETCMYLSPDPTTGCRMPRTCQSCLATEGCMINSVGSCVGIEDNTPDPSLDYHLAKTEGLVLPNATASAAALSGTQMWQFPAGEVKYCGLNDRICRSCTRNNFWRSQYVYPDSRYCIGTDGSCVCVDVCERRWFVQPDCSSTGGTPSPSMPYELSTASLVNRVWEAMVGSIVFVVIVLAIMIRSKRRNQAQITERATERRRRQEAQRERAARTGPAAQLGVNPLNLNGWETYRRDLIQKETAQLSSGIETSVSRNEEETIHITAPVDEDGTAYMQMVETEETPGPQVMTESSSTPTAEQPRPSDDPQPTLAPLTTTRTLVPQHGSSRLHL